MTDWLLITRLILAHLLSDFVLQPSAWVQDRIANKAKAKSLYLHIGVTTATAFVLSGFQWLPTLIICLSHYCIDLWKAYQKNNLTFFLADQALHLSVIFLLGFSFQNQEWVAIQSLSTNQTVWVYITALLFLCQPTGIVIGKIVEPWRDEVNDPAETLKNAGVYIGILERLLVFLFVVIGKYEIIGWLVAAKSILRFKETYAPKRTEYVLIGTLLSIGTAILVGLLVKVVG